MLETTLPFHAKSGVQTELPEDHCCNLEAPEDCYQEDEEPAASQ
ncbi:MAG TPA: hypothetical protein VH724_07960 [Candidatus Angelobacter sp.]|jgi:hypothetical protein|nr:hypothetical protein [Candidatus Angelobacter sp.]